MLSKMSFPRDMFSSTWGVPDYIYTIKFSRNIIYNLLLNKKQMCSNQPFEYKTPWYFLALKPTKTYCNVSRILIFTLKTLRMSALKVSFIASSGMVMIHSTMVVIVVPATGLFFGPVKKNL